jgi:hypothetical protein
MQLPIIRLEVEGMKRTIMAALAEHSAQMDADLQNAIEDYCTPENLARVVQNAAREQLAAAIQAEVKNFFWYGPGRKAVAEAVKESILKNETYTPLDDTGQQYSFKQNKV